MSKAKKVRQSYWEDIGNQLEAGNILIDADRLSADFLTDRSKSRSAMEGVATRANNDRVALGGEDLRDSWGHWMYEHPSYIANNLRWKSYIAPIIEHFLSKGIKAHPKYWNPSYFRLRSEYFKNIEDAQKAAEATRAAKAKQDLIDNPTWVF